VVRYSPAVPRGSRRAPLPFTAAAGRHAPHGSFGPFPSPSSSGWQLAVVSRERERERELFSLVRRRPFLGRPPSLPAAIQIHIIHPPWCVCVFVLRQLALPTLLYDSAQRDKGLGRPGRAGPVLKAHTMCAPASGNELMSHDPASPLMSHVSGHRLAVSPLVPTFPACRISSIIWPALPRAATMRGDRALAHFADT
jgi:hypothetical protein